MNNRIDLAKTGDWTWWLPIALAVLAQGITPPCSARSYATTAKWGYINTQGKFAIEPKFDYAQSFLFQLAYVRTGGEYRIIDEKGKLLPRAKSLKLRTNQPPSPDKDHGLKLVRADGKWTTYDANHKTTSLKVDFNRSENGLVPARDGKKYGYINKDYRFILEPKFDDAGYFCDGLALVRVGRHVGFIDSSGKFKIKPMFLDGRGFHDGLAAVKVKR